MRPLQVSLLLLVVLNASTATVVNFKKIAELYQNYTQRFLQGQFNLETYTTPDVDVTDTVNDVPMALADIPIPFNDEELISIDHQIHEKPYKFCFPTLEYIRSYFFKREECD